MEDFRIDIMVGKGAGATSIPLDLVAVHPRRRDDAVRAAAQPAARPLRVHRAPRVLRAGELEQVIERAARMLELDLPPVAAPRSPTPLPRHAAHREPPAAPRARLHARARRRSGGIDDRRTPRSTCTTSTRSASTGSTAPCSTRSSTGSTAAGRAQHARRRRRRGGRDDRVGRRAVPRAHRLLGPHAPRPGRHPRALRAPRRAPRPTSGRSSTMTYNAEGSRPIAGLRSPCPPGAPSTRKAPTLASTGRHRSDLLRNTASSSSSSLCWASCSAARASARSRGRAAQTADRPRRRGADCGWPLRHDHRGRPRESTSRARRDRPGRRDQGAQPGDPPRRRPRRGRRPRTSSTTEAGASDAELAGGPSYVEPSTTSDADSAPAHEADRVAYPRRCPAADDRFPRLTRADSDRKLTPRGDIPPRPAMPGAPSTGCCRSSPAARSASTRSASTSSRAPGRRSSRSTSRAARRSSSRRRPPRAAPPGAARPGRARSSASASTPPVSPRPRSRPRAARTSSSRSRARPTRRPASASRRRPAAVPRRALAGRPDRVVRRATTTARRRRR